MRLGGSVLRRGGERSAGMRRGLLFLVTVWLFAWFPAEDLRAEDWELMASFEGVVLGHALLAAECPGCSVALWPLAELQVGAFSGQVHPDAVALNLALLVPFLAYNFRMIDEQWHRREGMDQKEAFWANYLYGHLVWWAMWNHDPRQRKGPDHSLSLAPQGEGLALMWEGWF